MYQIYVCNSTVKEEKLVKAPFDLLKRSSSNQEKEPDCYLESFHCSH